jgi:(R,R)-butanediol dehydrogenase/meso-butanediol dehydrogenase/diacetyl reductase
VRAAVYHGPGDIRIEDVSDPAPGPGELLLEPHAVGICGTDAAEYVYGPKQYALAGHPVTGHRGPLIPGHEFSGRVVGVGPGAEAFRLGAVVASGAGISCGECFQCVAGRTNLCVRYATVGLQRNGALGQLCTVPAAICLDIEPFGLDEETAALAQPMAIGVHALRRGGVSPGEDVLVIGCGGIGAFLTFALCQAGARVAVVEQSAERLELAQALGAAELIEPVEGGTLLEQLHERGVRPRVIYEATGSERAFAEAVDAALPGGRLVAVGVQAGKRPVDLRRLTLQEVELIGTNAHVCGDDLPEALRLLAARTGGWADVAPTVLPLSELVSDGLGPMTEGRSTRIKTLVDPWADAPRQRG